MAETETIGAADVKRAVEEIAEAIARRHDGGEELHFVGIADGGIPLSKRLGKLLTERHGFAIQYGRLNIAFHRDDILHRPIPKLTFPTELEFGIDDREVIVVDDVMHTGRSARAALNELFDQGRPDRVELAVLFDRLSNRLPIKPDYVGIRRRVPEGRKVHVLLDEEDPLKDRIDILSADAVS